MIEIKNETIQIKTDLSMTFTGIDAERLKFLLSRLDCSMLNSLEENIGVTQLSLLKKWLQETQMKFKEMK